MSVIMRRWFVMSLGVGLEQELGDEFEGDFDEFDEFGVRLRCVC